MARPNPLKGKGDDRKSPGTREELWKARERRRGVEWKEVTALSMRACFASAVSSGVAVMISGASGGLGVCVTVWADNDRFKEYAATAEELMELLDGITDAYSSGSEDVRASLATEREH